MAIIFSRQVMERNFSGNPGAVPPPPGSHVLSLDLTSGTYTLVLDGATVSGLAALSADNAWVTVTTAAGSWVLHCRAIASVAQASANGAPFSPTAIGALLVANFANLNSFLNSAARALES